MGGFPQHWGRRSLSHELQHERPEIFQLPQGVTSVFSPVWGNKDQMNDNSNPIAQVPTFSSA